jgi:hypothetical protein
MRTTVRLPEDLMKAAKRRAVETGRTLTDVIEGALRLELSRGRLAAASQPVELPTYGSGGVLPGVDLDDSAALLDLMDRR